MNRLAALVFALVAAACTPPPAPFELDAPTPAVEPSVPATAPVVAALPVPALPPIRVWLDPRIDAEQIDAVRAGVDAWGIATAGVRKWVYVSDKADAELAIFEIGPYARLCDGQPETNALGCVRGTGGLWNNKSGEAMPLYLISGNYERAAKLTVMHEIGHLLGLTHAAGGFMTGPAPEAMLDAEWECPDAEPLDILQTKLDISGLTACAAPEME
jgi:hypothetical protein